MQIAARERGVDLDAQIRRMCAMHRRDGPVKRPRDAAERIMRLPRRAVQTQRNALHARRLDFMKISMDQPSRGRWAQPHMQTRRRRFAHQIQRIRTHQRITARQYQHRRIQFRQLLDQPARLRPV